MPHGLVLVCHPSSSMPWARGIAARVVARSDGALVFTFRLDAQLARLRIPPIAQPRRADRLCEHTCFEAFVAVKGEPAYHEFNFSPSGEWAAYAFRSYRQGAALDWATAPDITVRRAVDALELEAMIRADSLPPLQAAPAAMLQIALSAVIEDEAGQLSYWALRHAPGRPDFHHRDGFALALEAPHNAGSLQPGNGS